MGRILQQFPWVVPMHCVAHKLELAALDAVKESHLKKFEETIKGICMHYFYSPKHRRELKEIAEVIDVDLAHFGAVKQVCVHKTIIHTDNPCESCLMAPQM